MQNLGKENEVQIRSLELSQTNDHKKRFDNVIYININDTGI